MNVEHPENSDFCKVPNLNVPHVTDSLHSALHTERTTLGIALQGPVSDPQTVDKTMGLLLVPALSEFAFSDLFTCIRGAQGDYLGVRLANFQSRLGTIHRPEVIRIPWDLALRDTTSI